MGKSSKGSDYYEAGSSKRPNPNPERAIVDLNLPREEGEEGDKESDEGIITDLDVLDCPICYEPLTVPVFQCNNGHVACSSCSTKTRNKCPSCALPIGNNRCRAIEKVIESAKILCPFGCNEKIRYFDTKGHENSCVCVQFSCPKPSCAFSGSLDKLSSHFASAHPYRIKRFRFNEFIFVHLVANEEFEILQAEKGQLFVLNRRELPSIGTIVNVSRIQPSTSKTNFYYKMEAKKKKKKWDTCWPVVKLEAVVDNVARRDNNFNMSSTCLMVYMSSTCLTVPLDFIRSSKVVKVTTYQAPA